MSHRDWHLAVGQTDGSQNPWPYIIKQMSSIVFLVWLTSQPEKGRTIGQGVSSRPELAGHRKIGHLCVPRCGGSKVRRAVAQSHVRRPVCLAAGAGEFLWPRSPPWHLGLGIFLSQGGDGGVGSVRGLSPEEFFWVKRASAELHDSS